MVLKVAAVPLRTLHKAADRLLYWGTVINKGDRRIVGRRLYLSAMNTCRPGPVCSTNSSSRTPQNLIYLFIVVGKFKFTAVSRYKYIDVTHKNTWIRSSEQKPILIRTGFTVEVELFNIIIQCFNSNDAEFLGVKQVSVRQQRKNPNQSRDWKGEGNLTGPGGKVKDLI